MERLEARPLRDAEALLAHVAQACPTGPAAVLIDEVQEIRDFDVALRTLANESRFDLYVTGSNAELFSGEIATRFAGRAVSIEVHPLSYDEFLVFHGRADDDAALGDFLRFGGLPFLRHLPLRDELAFEYLHGVRKADLLERLLLCVADSVGSPVSAQSIVRFLKPQRTQTSVPTVLAHLEQLEQACLIRRVRRSDLEGKRFFEVAEKFYFEDLGIRAALRGSRTEDIGKLVENAVYNRLRLDGWQISTGLLPGDREIDFICTRGPERLYVQAAWLLVEPATRAREFGNLLAIPDNSPKCVVSLDPITADEAGVNHKGLRAFPRDGSG
jgi:predicted AAA+ superfamily ATPase